MYFQALICSLIVNFLLNAAALVSEKNDLCPNIIERSQWGARRSKSLNYLVIPLLYVVVHHTATPECEKFSSCADLVKGIQNSHMDDYKFPDIGHSFLVGGDGNIYEGTGWFTEGSHTVGYNKRAISLAFIGNFQVSYKNSTHGIIIEKEAQEKSLKAAYELITCGKAQGYLRQNVKVIGGRQVMSTESPGNRLYSQIQKWPEWTVVPR